MATTPSEEWSQYESPTGDMYYYNETTGESSWTDPTVAAGAPVKEGEEEHGVGGGEEYYYEEGGEGEEVLEEAGAPLTTPQKFPSQDPSREPLESDFLPNSPALEETWRSLSHDNAHYENAAHDVTDAAIGDVTATTLDTSYPSTSYPATPLQTDAPDASAFDSINPLTAKTAFARALDQTGWVRYYTATNDPYYYNLELGETRWTVPDEVARLESHLTVIVNSFSPAHHNRSNFASPTKPVVKSASSNLSTSPYTYSRSTEITSSASSNKKPTLPHTAHTLPLTTTELTISATSLALTPSRLSPTNFADIHLDKIRRRFHAVAMNYGGVDWSSVFHRFDVNSDGMLDRREFVKAVRKGLRIEARDISERDLDVLLKTLDKNGDGGVDLKEFSDFLDEPSGRISPNNPSNALVHGVTTTQVANRLRRSLVGIRPPPSKSSFNSHNLSRMELSRSGGAAPSFDKAKSDAEESGMQARARNLAQDRMQSSARGVGHGDAARKITAVTDARSRLQRLGPRANPRGQRMPTDLWVKAGHRAKIAHAASKIWKSPEVRHAAYDAMLGAVKESDLGEMLTSFEHARFKHRGSKITPAVFEVLRKRLKSDAYTPRGVDYVNLYARYDEDRCGSLTEERWRVVMRKHCKLTPNELSDDDCRVVFETIAGEREDPTSTGDEPEDVVMVPNEGMDMEHFLKFVKTDAPAALSLSRANHGRVSQVEVLMYVVEKAKERILSNADRHGVTDWTAVFQMHDADGNGALSYDEFSNIFRKDLSLGLKELSEKELKLCFDFIDDDMSGDVSSTEFVRFLHHGVGDRRFPVRGDETVLESKDFQAKEETGHTKLTKSGLESHKWFAEQEFNKKMKHLKDVTELVRKRIRAHSYTTAGQDWSISFDAFDKSHDGYVEFSEFRVGVRKIINIPPLVVPDKDLMMIFRHILKDEEQQDWMSATNFHDFMEGGIGNADEVKENFAADWVYVDEDAAKQRLLKRFKHKVLQASYKNTAGVDLASIFHMIDKDSNGSISHEELSDGVRKMLKVPESDIDKTDIDTIFEHLDRDKSGALSIAEFIQFLHQ